MGAIKLNVKGQKYASIEELIEIFINELVESFETRFRWIDYR